MCLFLAKLPMGVNVGLSGVNVWVFYGLLMTSVFIWVLLGYYFNGEIHQIKVQFRLFLSVNKPAKPCFKSSNPTTRTR